MRSPYFEVTYEGHEITEDISPDVIEVNYSDAVEGEVDELTILLDDVSGKWKGGWRSVNGDRLQVKMGYSTDDLLDCGTFEIDEVHYKGQPDTVEIKALAITVNSDLKVIKSDTFEGQSLLQIGEKIAEDAGLTIISRFSEVVDDLSPVPESNQYLVDYRNKVMNLVIGRVTQDRESGLAFLNRIGDKYGVSFSTRDTFLYFFVRFEALKTPVTNYVLIEPEEELETIVLKSYSLKDSAEGISEDVEVVYHNENQNLIYKYRAEAASFPDKFQISTVDKYLSGKRQDSIYEDVDNQQQAEIIADAHWIKKATKKVEGSMDMEGWPSLIAGTSFNINGLGDLSGEYFIQKSKHKIARSSGYTTSVEVTFVTSES